MGSFTDEITAFFGIHSILQSVYLLVMHISRGFNFSPENKKFDQLIPSRARNISRMRNLCSILQITNNRPLPIARVHVLKDVGDE